MMHWHCIGYTINLIISTKNRNLILLKTILEGMPHLVNVNYKNGRHKREC